MKLTILVICLLLTACGQNGASKKSHHHEDSYPEVSLDLDDSIDGQYLAVFETLNPQITNKVTGAFTFSREKEIDELVGDVRITNAGSGIIHAQNVRVGRKCPTIEDDSNHDGIIDDSEGEVVYGKIFIPLDGDLSTQSSHDGEFPKGNIYGNYIYSQVTSFNRFMKDLRNTEDNEGYVKLKPSEPLEIEGRVVVVHGVDEAADLPITARSGGRSSVHQSLPIVCGVIKKITTLPTDSP